MPPQDPQVVLQDPSTAATLANVYADSNGDLLLHEADSGNEVKVSANGFDLNGNSLTDTTQGFLDLTGDGNDLRLATGQSIEDGSGTERLTFFGGSTYLRDQNEEPFIVAAGGGVYRLNARANEPIVVEDRNGSFEAWRYTTSASSPGTLELTNARLDFSESVSDTNDSMTANPETDTESGYITVNVNGTAKQIPVYDP